MKRDNKRYTLELELQEFFKTASFVSESLTGDFGVQDLEKRVRDLAETTPLLMRLLAAAGEAQNRIDQVREQPYQEDPELVKQLLQHIETFCCLQGSIATLLIVSEVLRKENSSKTPTRKKKIP